MAEDRRPNGDVREDPEAIHDTQWEAHRLNKRPVEVCRADHTYIRGRRCGYCGTYFRGDDCG